MKCNKFSQKKIEKKEQQNNSNSNLVEDAIDANSKVH